MTMQKCSPRIVMNTENFGGVLMTAENSLRDSSHEN